MGTGAAETRPGSGGQRQARSGAGRRRSSDPARNSRGMVGARAPGRWLEYPSESKSDETRKTRRRLS